MEDKANEKEKHDIIDDLERLKFFNCRGGRELWGDKPIDVQNQDIESADKILNGAINTIQNLRITVEILVEHARFHSCYDCKKCENHTCPYVPDPGDHIRSNCVHWKGE